MSDTSAVESLRALCRQAERDVLKAEKELEKIQRKLAEAQSKYKILSDALTHVAGGEKPDGQPAKVIQTFQDLVDFVISTAGLGGISAKEIQTNLESRGIKLDGNASATIYMAAERLREKGSIDIIDGPTSKIFRTKRAVPHPQISPILP